jgi:hypothetical protein
MIQKMEKNGILNIKIVNAAKDMFIIVKEMFVKVLDNVIVK